MEQEYQSLRRDWSAGNRNRDASLRLLFLAFMHWADPDFVTQLSPDPEATPLWHSIFCELGGESSADAEFLHVASIMTRLFPWELGDEQEWLDRGHRMAARSKSLQPEGFTPEHFKGRGDYGEYFSHVSF